VTCVRARRGERPGIEDLGDGELPRSESRRSLGLVGRRHLATSNFTIVFPT
jgi:hypothetical protein